MIVGEEQPDEGDVSVPKRMTIGYFRQDVEEMSGRSVIDEVIAGSGRLGDLHHELEALQHAMADPAQADDMDRILARFGEVQEEYDHLGGYAIESQAREILHGLGFDDERIDGDVGALERRVEDARGHGAGDPRQARRAADGRADQPPGHRVDHLARGVPQVAALGAADDEPRPRLHEPDRHRRSPRSTAARSRRTRATTTSTNASGRSARPTARPRTRGSRRCSPRSSGSSIASRPTPPRPARSRAA